jgi:hypothetical protein
MEFTLSKVLILDEIHKNLLFSRYSPLIVGVNLVLAHLLEVSAIEGEFGETVALGEVIPPGIDSQTWLKVLEKSMKTTLIANFTNCLISSWSRTEDETLVNDFRMKGTALPIAFNHLL